MKPPSQKLSHVRTKIKLSRGMRITYRFLNIITDDVERILTETLIFLTWQHTHTK
jgi:hypothetical protein